MRKIEEYYVAIWCLFMPVTSFLLIPAIQGTIIPYMMGFGSIVFVLTKITSGRFSPEIVGYFKSFILVGVLWSALLVGSQLADMINPPNDVLSMFTISTKSRLLMRASLFTQSIYLLACVMIALYFRYFMPEKWMKYVYLGGWFFALYGLYDWAFYLVFKTSGDFIANRTFMGGDHPGSWAQGISLGPLQLIRLKSCLGEPSFVAAVVIPYLLMAIDGRKRVLTALLFIAAVLTTSTTVYLGMLVTFVIQIILSNRSRGPGLVVLAIFGLALVALKLLYPDFFDSIFGQKFSGDNDSGNGRMKNIEEYLHLYSQFNILNWIFGVGFGYLYFTLGWALTANTGLLGVGSFLYTMLKPAFLLPREPGYEWLKISMFSIVIVMILSVSELFIPTTWMFIGLAHRSLSMYRAQRPGPTGRPHAEPVRARQLEPLVS